MGIGQNYFEKAFGKLDIKQKRNGASIEINFERMGRRFDIAQDELDKQIWKDMKKYMPYSTTPGESGNLIQKTEALNMNTRGEVYKYDPNVEYAHYQYEGFQYIDPKYLTAAFYSPEYGYWSRPGVDKVKSMKLLKYQNPDARWNWDEKAYDLHHKQWVKVAKDSIKG